MISPSKMLEFWRSPKVFCAGVIVGFLACCLAGRAVAQRNVYANFIRIHAFIGPETQHYPTASQLRAIVRAQCPEPRIPVIIGGNSVFNGSGQKGAQLWSRVLQAELGDDYRVINFAAAGAGPADTGGIAYEMLAREYPKMVFVTNAEPGRYPPPELSPYSYLFWDAYYKGLLLPDIRREARLAAAAPTADQAELRRSRQWDRALYFHDLWNAVAYRYVSTVWTSWIKDRPFTPRCRLPDWYDGRPGPKPMPGRFEDLLPGQLEALRGRPGISAARFREEADGSWVLAEESRRRETEQLQALLPDPLKPRALVVLTPYNPWFTARLAESERTRLALSFRTGLELLGATGWHALAAAGTFEPAEFMDIVHLAPSGAVRLAALVAPAVREIARQPVSAP